MSIALLSIYKISLNSYRNPTSVLVWSRWNVAVWTHQAMFVLYILHDTGLVYSNTAMARCTVSLPAGLMHCHKYEQSMDDNSIKDRSMSVIISCRLDDASLNSKSMRPRCLNHRGSAVRTLCDRHTTTLHTHFQNQGLCGYLTSVLLLYLWNVLVTARRKSGWIYFYQQTIKWQNFNRYRRDTNSTY